MKHVRIAAFLRASDFSDGGRPVNMDAFKALKTREALVEFEMVEGREGKPRAARPVEFRWGAE